MSYNWPGNVRELENTIKRAVVITTGEVLGVNDVILNAESCTKEFQELSVVIDGLFERTINTQAPSDSYHSILSRVEKCLIEKALNVTKGNQVQASALLGITRVTLRKKMQEFKIPSV